MKKIAKSITFFGVFLALGFIGNIFYNINENNYDKHQEIQQTIINHPEFLPDSQSAQIVSSGFQKLSSDIYWLQTVQYIGGNVLSEAYKEYLAAMIGLITDLDPFFTQSYVAAQLLLPEDRPSVEEEKRNLYNQQALDLGKKGIKNTCDAQKISAIMKETDLKKILTEERYSNPCNSYKIPYHQAFTEYFYLENYENAANLYKIVSAQKDAPTGAKNLAAIMTGKSGNRETSLRMFLSLSQSIKTQDEACTLLGQELESVYDQILSNKSDIPAELISKLGDISRNFAPEVTEKNEAQILKKTECTNYALKAIRELNLMYLEEAAAKYIADGKDVSILQDTVLLQEGYISYVPQDFQTYTDSNQGILYLYDQELGTFDYVMGIVE